MRVYAFVCLFVCLLPCGLFVGAYASSSESNDLSWPPPLVLPLSSVDMIYCGAGV